MLKKNEQLPLITCFLKDKVRITTNLISAIQLPDGEIAEAPLVLEGTLLDNDDTFILLGQTDSDALELLAISSIVAMKQVLVEEEVMEDPSKPKTSDMN